MNQLVQHKAKPSLVAKMADKFGVEPEKMIATLKATAFRVSNGPPVTNEQMMALLVVADQYGLNPWTKEIYAFPDKQDGIVPVVGVDGWSRIINEQPQLDGIEFAYSEAMISAGDLDGLERSAPEWCECTMYRKDRSKPTTVREYLDEVYRPPFRKTGSNGPYVIKGPWQTHTRRFLRHKALIQCARVAFSLVGIYDQDEAERIIEAEVIREEPRRGTTLQDIKAAAEQKQAEPEQAAIEPEPDEQAEPEPDRRTRPSEPTDPIPFDDDEWGKGYDAEAQRQEAQR